MNVVEIFEKILKTVIYTLGENSRHRWSDTGTHTHAYTEKEHTETGIRTFTGIHAHNMTLNIVLHNHT